MQVLQVNKIIRTYQGSFANSRKLTEQFSSGRGMCSTQSITIYGFCLEIQKTKSSKKVSFNCTNSWHACQGMPFSSCGPQPLDSTGILLLSQTQCEVQHGLWVILRDLLQNIWSVCANAALTGMWISRKCLSCNENHVFALELQSMAYIRWIISSITHAWATNFQNRLCKTPVEFPSWMISPTVLRCFGLVLPPWLTNTSGTIWALLYLQLVQQNPTNVTKPSPLNEHVILSTG